MTIPLRPYQRDLVTDLRVAFLFGARRALAVMPTGAGKSRVAATIIRNAKESGKRVLFAVNRISLVQQFSDTLNSFGIEHGILWAGTPYKLAESVQVASIDTLDARYFGKKADGDADVLGGFDLIVYDEAHTQYGMYLRLIGAYPKAFVVGFTATPTRGAGLGLGDGYDVIVEGPTVRELTDAGYLVPMRYFIPEIYDVTGIRVGVNGEYSTKGMTERFDRSELVGNVVEKYLELGEGRPFVAFALSTNHAMHLFEMFNAAGIVTVYLDANTPADERKSVYDAVQSGAVRGIVNYGVIERGVDIPALSCCILVRPMRRIATYRQAIGRVMRPHPGKRDAIVIDHGGNVPRHLFADTPIEWSLDPGESLEDREQKEREAKEPKEIICESCSGVFDHTTAVVRAGVLRCPHCGAERERAEVFSRPEVWVDGVFVEVDRARRERQRFEEDAERWHRMMTGYAMMNNVPVSEVGKWFKSKFGSFPTESFVKPLTPNEDVERHCYNMILRKRIAYRKARERAA